MGEQFISQLLRLIPERQWLFKFGRVPMSFILSDWVWQVRSGQLILNLNTYCLCQRILPPNMKVQCKLSVIAEATAAREEVLPFAVTQPYNEQFFPEPPVTSRASGKRKVGNPFRVVNLIPLSEQVSSPMLLTD